MKNISDVLAVKKTELARLVKEVQSLELVLPLLLDDPVEAQRMPDPAEKRWP